MYKQFWNEEIETLSQSDIDRLEAPLIAQQIDYVYQSSSYYKNRLDEAGVDPSQITCKQSLKNVPFMEKSDVTDAQKSGDLFGPHQCAEFDEIVRIMGSGGTSGQPTRIGWTVKDIEAYNEMGARGLWTAHCRPDKFVVSCFNYSMYAGGVMDHMSFEYLGAAILPYSVGRSQRLIEMMQNFPKGRDFSLYATPSYAVRLIDVAHDMGVDLKSLNFQNGYFSGEAGLQIEGYRQKIEQAWGMTAWDVYGAAELGVQSGECEHKNGLHFSGAGLVVAELINPDNGEVLEMHDGAIGELVYTSLKRKACPLIRLRSRDVIQVYTEPCKCGRKSFRFHLLGRSDDMFIVKGVNVFPLGVQEALLSLVPKITAEFFILLGQAPPIDYAPQVYLEVTKETELEQQ